MDQLHKWIHDWQVKSHREQEEVARTILMRWPGVVVRAQVHAFLLGYLSGQFGLVRIPLTLFTVWSQPAAEIHHRIQHRKWTGQCLHCTPPVFLTQNSRRALTLIDAVMWSDHKRKGTVENRDQKFPYWGEIPSLQSCLFSWSTKPLLHWQL